MGKAGGRRSGCERMLPVGNEQAAAQLCCQVVVGHSLGEDKYWPGQVQHLAQAGERELEIKGQVGPPGFQDSQQHGDLPGAARQADAHDRIADQASLTELSGDPAGQFVELLVGEGLVVSDQGRCLGALLHLACEEIVNPEIGEFPIEPLAPGEELLKFLRLEQRDGIRGGHGLGTP